MQINSWQAIRLKWSHVCEAGRGVYHNIGQYFLPFKHDTDFISLMLQIGHTSYIHSDTSASVVNMYCLYRILISAGYIIIYNTYIFISIL